jgi:hypothetical protein
MASSSLLLHSSDVLSAENILAEIRRAQEREESLRAEEEIRQRKFSSTSANAERFLHVKSLRNIASNLRSRMGKPKSDLRRSSAPPPLAGQKAHPPPPSFASFSFASREATAPSSDLRNPLSSSGSYARDLRRPLVMASDQRPEDEDEIAEISQQQRDIQGGEEIPGLAYQSPASPTSLVLPVPDPIPLSRLFKSQSGISTPVASPAPSRPQSSRTPSSRGLFGGEYLLDREDKL